MKTKSSKKERVAVLGCGWLGKPLALSLKAVFKEVYGSTTSAEKLVALQSEGIRAFQVSIQDEALVLDPAFLEVSTLIIAVPFGAQKRNKKAFVALQKQIVNSSIQHIIYVSSTGIYANGKGRVTESKIFLDPAKEDLLFFENLFTEHSPIQTTVIRFGGLIDENRHPGTFFQRKKVKVAGNAPVNLIHREDCIGVIHHIIEKGFWGEIVNAVSPHHPTKEKFYTQAILLKGGNLPEFIEDKNQNKEVSETKLTEDWNYTFVYPNLFDCLE